MGKLQEAFYTKEYSGFTITENTNPSQGTPEQGFPSMQPHTHLTTGQVSLPWAWLAIRAIPFDPRSMSRLAPCLHPGQGKEFDTSETSALQSLSKLPLAHQDEESGAEMMEETQGKQGCAPPRPASQSPPQGRGGESLDQGQKALLLSCPIPSSPFASISSCMFHSVSLSQSHVTPIKSHTSQTKFPRFLLLKPVPSLRAT